MYTKHAWKGYLCHCGAGLFADAFSTLFTIRDDLLHCITLLKCTIISQTTKTTQRSVLFTPCSSLSKRFLLLLPLLLLLLLLLRAVIKRWMIRREEKKKENKTKPVAFLYIEMRDAKTVHRMQL